MINLEKDEQLIMIVRRHWIFVVGRILSSAILFVLPLALIRFLSVYGILKLGGNQTALFSGLAGAWFLLIWIAFFTFWTRYYLTIWVVTDKRIIGLSQKALFSREASSMRLDRIQDIDVNVRGIFSTLLGVGTLKVQSAGEDLDEDFTMVGIAKPYDVKETISRLVSAELEKVKTVKLEQPE